VLNQLESREAGKLESEEAGKLESREAETPCTLSIQAFWPSSLPASKPYYAEFLYPLK
jgi:hypothetical protein